MLIYTCTYTRVYSYRIPCLWRARAIYTCICICMYDHIHVYIYMRRDTRICILYTLLVASKSRWPAAPRSHDRTYICVDIQEYVCMCVFCICMCICMQIFTCVRICVQTDRQTDTQTHRQTHTHTHTLTHSHTRTMLSTYM